MNKHILTACALLLASTTVLADTVPVDLSTWSTPDINGNWNVAPDNNSVVQTINGDPTVFLNGVNQTSYTLDGTWRVNTTGDDDMIGFVFGYQNAQQYYLLDWKQNAQSFGGLGTAPEGFRIMKVDADAPIAAGDFWGASSPAFTTLASNTGAGTGWDDNTLYTFNLDFFTTPGQFSIEVKQDDLTLWDVMVMDTAFTNGQFGFYNYSQAQVQYAGFTQTLVEPPSEVPLPAAFWMFAPALMGFLGLRRRQSKV